MTVNIGSDMHSNAFQCIAQPNTTLHGCHNMSMVPGSADQCILGTVYLRSDLSRKCIDLGGCTVSVIEIAVVTNQLSI